MYLIDLIGNTPLAELKRMNPNPEAVRILAKIESRNPGGSIKDRAALSMILAAEERGELSADKIVLEATSGNTGIGMAMVCAIKGYQCQLIMPESASVERRMIMQAYGAEIVLTPAKRGTDGAIEKAYALARENPDLYYLADQFNNPANWQAHYASTAPEIWRQTEGRVTDVVLTLGTSGTAMGLARWFREYQPQVRVIAVEPYLGHKIQGLKNMKESYRPGIFDKTLPHSIVNIADEDAFRSVRRLALEEGLFVGMSSGAAMFVAMEHARQLDQGCIVVIFPDGGERYLSTPLFAQRDRTSPSSARLRVYNTMSRKKEVFKPLNPERVTLYSCGPTAFESPNLAHCRRLIVSDLIQRWLKQCGYPVVSYMNFTDLDDNTIAGAMQAGVDLRSFTASYIQEFKEVIELLGIEPASGYPLASEHIGDMIEITHELIHKGYAYEKLGSIYFDISKFHQYGALSGVDLAKIKLGQTVDLDNYEKDNPRDFTLLKRSTLAELKEGIFFETDWGNVRPGWHIECSAMATRHLGQTLDIHTASQDLMFPHHENEIAIAQALTGKDLAKYWLHSGQLMKDGRKMAADANNVVTARQVVQGGYTGRELRFMLLSVHYRKPLHFSYKRLEAARIALRRVDEYLRKLLCLPEGPAHGEVKTWVAEFESAFNHCMNDDLNVSGAMGALFYFIKRTNPLLLSRNLDRGQKEAIIEVLRPVQAVLGFLRLEQCPLNPEIDALIQQREAARRQKDWSSADGYRRQLLERGVSIHDTASGPVWECLGCLDHCQQTNSSAA